MFPRSRRLAAQKVTRSVSEAENDVSPSLPSLTLWVIWLMAVPLV